MTTNRWIAILAAAAALLAAWLFAPTGAMAALFSPSGTWTAPWGQTFQIVGGGQFEPEKAWAVRAVALLLAVPALLRFKPSSGAVVAAGIVGLSFAISTAAGMWPALSWAGSPARMEGLATTLSYLCLFLAVASLPREWLAVPIGAALWASLPVCLYAIGQRFHLDPLPWTSDPAVRVWGTLGNADLLGGWLAMLLPLTIANAQLARGARPLAAFLGLAGLQIITIGLTHALGAMIAAFAGSVLLGILQWPSGFWLLAGLVGSIIATAVLLPVAQTKSASLAVRTALWSAAEQTWEERPWLGHGPETQALGILNVAPVAAREGQPDRAHNALLDVLVERGLFGLAAELILAVAVAITALRSRAAHSLALLAALAAHAVDSLAGVQGVTSQLTAWIFAGGIVALKEARV